MREQSVTNRLIDELHSQQTSLSEVFSVLARDPDSVDYDQIMSQFDEADRDIDRISGEGAGTAEQRPLAAPANILAGFSRGGAPPAVASTSPRLFPPSICSAITRPSFRGGPPDRSRVPQGERGAGANRPPASRLLRHLAALRRGQRAAGAGLRRGHGAHGLAAHSPDGVADRRTGPRLLAHAGRPGGHRAPLLARAARRAGPVAHRHQDQSQRPLDAPGR